MSTTTVIGLCVISALVLAVDFTLPKQDRLAYVQAVLRALGRGRPFR